MTKILFLFCAIGTAPSDCTVATAPHVRGPLVNSPLSCVQGAQMFLTSSEYPFDAKKSYLKIVCERAN